MWKNKDRLVSMRFLFEGSQNSLDLGDDVVDQGSGITPTAK